MLRHEYVLGIAPAHDGQFHPLGVKVRENENYQVFVRQGYRAP